MKSSISIFLLLVAHCIAMAQTNDQLYREGLNLRNKYKDKEAFEIFKKLYQRDSSNANYTAQAGYGYAKIGATKSTEAERMKYYLEAERLGKKALSQDNKNAEAHYTYALALGRLNENASSKQKIRNAKLIKKEAERVLQLDPNHAGAYHILGRWHRTIAGFNSIEKAMINTFFGGVPEGGTYEDAKKCFIKAALLQPDYILHYYELAVTYKDTKEYEMARAVLKKALQIPPAGEVDKKRLEDCQKLYDELD